MLVELEESRPAGAYASLQPRVPPDPHTHTHLDAVTGGEAELVSAGGSVGELGAQHRADGVLWVAVLDRSWDGDRRGRGRSSCCSLGGDSSDSSAEGCARGHSGGHGRGSRHVWYVGERIRKPSAVVEECTLDGDECA
jgi:hypothetical protein